MKQYLILGVFAAGASQAAVTVVPPPMPRAAAPTPAVVAPRRLSDAERAELRRQLQEFNRRYTNGHP
jgi:uncharacterized membrane protein